MRATARFWSVVALALSIAGWGILVEQIEPVIGAGGIVAWLFAMQFRFVQSTKATLETATVEQTVSPAAVFTGNTSALTIKVAVPNLQTIDCMVTPQLPISADGHTESFTVEDDKPETVQTIDVSWPVAGTFSVDSPFLEFEDPFGFFVRKAAVGPTETVRVQPRTPQEIHIGQGGDPVAAGLGDHEAEQSGRGLEPQEVRQYVPGDAVRDIDWKATARLDEPHVREFEAEANQQTIVLIDHRETLATGPPGQTKLDYLRQVGLTFVEAAEIHNDPVGYYGVGDQGLTEALQAAGNRSQYHEVREHLQTVTPTEEQTTTDSVTQGTMSPSRAQRAHQRLVADQSDFGKRLSPYYERRDTYIERVAEQPLISAAQAAITRTGGSVRVVIITDDERRSELREAIKLLQQQQIQVLVFMAPTTLYEPGGLSDLDNAYDQYTDFESFRRSLTSIDRVSAFEVGPADRVNAILATARNQYNRQMKR